MRLTLSSTIALLGLCEPITSFVPNLKSGPSISSKLHVSIGLGPEPKTDDGEQEKELIPGVDYEVPDHESYRTSRRSKIDEQCDKWFGALLGTEDDNGILGSLADDAREILLTPVPLVNEVCVKNSLLPTILEKFWKLTFFFSFLKKKTGAKANRG